MRGHIRRRERINASGKKTVRWHPVVYLGRDPDTGRKRYDEREGYRIKAEAEVALNRRLADIGAGEFITPTKLTVEDYIKTNWLPTARTRVKTTTWRNYEAMADRYVIPILGGRRLAELTTADVNTLYARLLVGDLPVDPRRTRHEQPRVPPASRPHRPRTNQPLSNKTVANVHLLVRKVLKDAVDEGVLSRNPAERAKPPRWTKPEIQAWTPHELHQFLRAVSTEPDYGLWHLMAMTGLRRGEALGLRWGDVELDDRTLSVRRNLVLIGPSATAMSTPKNGKSRVLDLDDRTCDVLRTHRTQIARERLAFGVGYQHNDLVFPAPDGTPKNPDRVSRRFGVLRDRAMKSEGIAVRITLHGLRHSHASHALQVGTHVKVVSERLGHASPAFTMAVYQHLLPSMQRDAVDSIAALINNAG